MKFIFISQQEAFIYYGGTDNDGPNKDYFETDRYHNVNDWYEVGYDLIN